MKPLCNHIISHRSRIRMWCGLAMLALAQLPAPHARAQYDLTWNTIDGGGGMFSTGGTFSLGGTIGQPDAQTPPVMTGGGFELTGGFWAAAVPTCTCPGDLDGNGQHNGKDIQQFVACAMAAGPVCACADVNGNSGIDPGDVTTFVSMLLTSAPCP